MIYYHAGSQTVHDENNIALLTAPQESLARLLVLHGGISWRWNGVTFEAYNPPQETEAE